MIETINFLMRMEKIVQNTEEFDKKNKILMQVKLIQDDKENGLKKGKIYKAKRYHLDPHEKVTIIINDKEYCNQYLSNIKILEERK